jgi:hypothetical protein
MQFGICHTAELAPLVVLQETSFSFLDAGKKYYPVFWELNWVIYFLVCHFTPNNSSEIVIFRDSYGDSCIQLQIYINVCEFDFFFLVGEVPSEKLRNIIQIYSNFNYFLK